MFGGRGRGEGRGAVRATRGWGCQVRKHRSGQRGRGQPRDWGGDPGGREEARKKMKQTEAQNLQEGEAGYVPSRENSAAMAATEIWGNS